MCRQLFGHWLQQQMLCKQPAAKQLKAAKVQAHTILMAIGEPSRLSRYAPQCNAHPTSHNSKQASYRMRVGRIRMASSDASAASANGSLITQAPSKQQHTVLNFSNLANAQVIPVHPAGMPPHANLLSYACMQPSPNERRNPQLHLQSNKSHNRCYATPFTAVACTGHIRICTCAVGAPRSVHIHVS